LRSNDENFTFGGWTDRPAAEVSLGSSTDSPRSSRHVRFTPCKQTFMSGSPRSALGQEENDAPQHNRRATNRKTASRRSLKSNQVFSSGRCECSGCLPLPAPSKQTHRAEAGEKKLRDVNFKDRRGLYAPSTLKSPIKGSF
jgi:hypothetical protein